MPEKTITPFTELLEELRFEAGQYDEEVAKAVADVEAQPLPDDEKRALLTAVYTRLKESPIAQTDPQACAALAADVRILVDHAIRRHRAASTTTRTPARILTEADFPRPVVPKPRFHGMQIDLVEVWVDPRDLQLWPDNDRLEIHVAEFKKLHRRPPSQDELLTIMLSQIELPGVLRGEDEFGIRSLAQSIANNGVRVPPIIDHWGVPQDGNRRLAACLLILSSDDYTNEQKQRVQRILVRKMSEFAQPPEYRAVVVGLNFEPDEKIEWPEYIKARKVAEDWENMLAAEGGEPTPQRRRELRRRLAESFVISTDRVDRYLKMVEWADRFEEHHRLTRGRGTHEVQRAASEHFQYFAEMSIGLSEGGVAHTLKTDDELRTMTFDLLYDGKIKAFPLVRELPKVARSQEARDLLLEAVAMPADEKSLPYAREKVSDAVAEARANDRELRALGADAKIRSFVKWFLSLPLDVFEEKCETKTLEGLVQAFKKGVPLVEQALAAKRHSP
jgi:hypothetical protein